MGADLHPGLSVQLQSQRRQRGPKVGTAFLNDPQNRCWIFDSLFSCSRLCFCSICERVTPRLSHANSAVVLSAVKVLMKFLELLPKDSDYYNTLLKKLSPPLVTLLSGEPEVQYVALRNINLIVQKRCVLTSRCGLSLSVKTRSPFLVWTQKEWYYFSFRLTLCVCPPFIVLLWRLCSGLRSSSRRSKCSLLNTTTQFM